MSDEGSKKVDSHEAFFSCYLAYQKVMNLTSEFERKTLARIVLPGFEKEMEKVEKYVKGHSILNYCWKDLKNYAGDKNV